MPVMAEVSVIPIGTGRPSVGKLVADALQALAAHPNVRYELGAMGTTLTGELDDVLLACGAMSRAVLAAGSPRCYTIIKLDQRADKGATAEEKVSSVLRHLPGGDAP
jgi:uncharacterized protein (TIGR00106 family)